MVAAPPRGPFVTRSARARLLRRAAPLLDRVMQPVTWLAARQMRLLRALTPPGAPRNFALLDRAGIYPLIDHYYEPLINLGRLARPLSERRRIAGLDFGLERARMALAVLEGLDCPGQSAAQAVGMAYDPSNTMFCPLDAGALYGVVLANRPRRIVEVGCGMSTLVFQSALAELHRRDPEYKCEHVCIEPFEAQWLERLPVKVLRLTAEAAPPALLQALAPGDVLFIDSSHVIRPQGDVVTEVLEWLGELAPGVLVHIHDIYTPFDYPDELLRRHRFLWNEQYLVEAFLCFNRSFEVLFPMHALWRDHATEVDLLCPSQRAHGRTTPSSLWLRRIEPGP